MRICLVTQQYKEVKSGVGVYSRLLAQGLRKEGVDAEIITTNCKESYSDVCHPVHLSIPDPTPNHWFSASLGFARKIKELKKGNGYDLIHFCDAREALFCNVKGIPLVGTQHDCLYPTYSGIPLSSLQDLKTFFPWDWRRRYIYYRFAKRFEKKALHRYDSVIAVSRYAAENIIDSYSLNARNVHVIYTGYPAEDIPDSVRPFTDRLNRILFVGRNFQRRNLLMLLRALARVIETVPDVELLIVGSDVYTRKFQGECKRLGVALNCSFTGALPHDEVMRLYSTAKVLAMPSLYEAFGLVFLEAMSRGVPVVAGSIGGAGEHTREGVDGFLVKPQDPETLARRLTEMLTDGEIWSRMSRSCRERVRDFHLEKMVRETIEVYEHTLKHRTV